MKTLLTVALAAAILFGGAGASRASVPCNTYAVVASLLAGKYNERPVMRGLANNAKTVLEVWRSDAGSWTIVILGTNGHACIANSGKDMHPVQAPPVGEPS